MSPDAYPDSATATIREWWWEFTRRRPDYRAAWEAGAPTNEWGYRYAPDVDAFRLKFEMSCIYDPAREFRDYELWQMRYPVNAGYLPTPINSDALDWHNARQKMEAEFGLYYYKFDLTRPLKPQLDSAQVLMGKIQEELHPDVKARRLIRKLWPDHLRALDARDAGATYAEIAAVLNPDDAESEFWARDRCAAAIRLRDNFPV